MENKAIHLAFMLNILIQLIDLHCIGFKIQH